MRIRKPSARGVVKALGALLAVAVVVGPTVAWASPSSQAGSDPSAERAQVRAQKAKVAGDVNALRATSAQVDQALAALVANVNGEQALLSESQRAAAQADQVQASAEAAVAAKQAEIDALRVDIRKFAVEAFVHPPGDDALATLDTADPGKAAQKRALLELQNTNNADLLDRLSAAQQDLDANRKLAADAANRAKAKKAQVAAHLAGLQTARDQQAKFADQVQGRLDQALGEAANLASLDASLSRQIAQEELARAALAGNGTGAGGGGGPVGNVDLGSASCPGGGRITVAASIAGNVQKLLDAASADGVSLCGGGYRSSQAQVEARRQNGCPDVYNSPASDCHPPTAPPGRSMHERGLAIDFTCNGGGVITSQGSPCWQWLNGHAGSYGLYNLPGEPWHWSTTGN